MPAYICAFRSQLGVYDLLFLGCIVEAVSWFSFLMAISEEWITVSYRLQRTGQESAGDVMDPNKLQAMLGNVSGHLKTGVLRDDHQLQSLHRSLARSLFAEDVQQLKTSSFRFENSDLFSPQQIPADLSDALRSVAEQSTAPAAEPEFRAFVRELPVRTTQVSASAPLWSAGAGVDHTIGPFTNKDGRQFWFDFFRIEKLVALYIQGQPDPALLFKTMRRLQFIDPMLPPIVDPAPSYNLSAGSIWINARIFAASAPP